MSPCQHKQWHDTMFDITDQLSVTRSMLHINIVQMNGSIGFTAILHQCDEVPCFEYVYYQDYSWYFLSFLISYLSIHLCTVVLITVLTSPLTWGGSSKTCYFWWIRFLPADFTSDMNVIPHWLPICYHCQLCSLNIDCLRSSHEEEMATVSWPLWIWVRHV